MINFEQLEAEAIAEIRNPLDLYLLERANSSLLPGHPGGTAAERLESYLKMRLVQDDHDHGHSAWLHFFEEFLLHAATRACRGRAMDTADPAVPPPGACPRARR